MSKYENRIMQHYRNLLKRIKTIDTKSLYSFHYIYILYLTTVHFMMPLFRRYFIITTTDVALNHLTIDCKMASIRSTKRNSLHCFNLASFMDQIAMQ